MIRSLASLVMGLAIALLINFTAAIVFRFPDMYWSLGWEWGLAARLFVASSAGAIVAAKIARRARGLHAAIAAVPSLVVSYDWWRTGDAAWLVTLLAISGVLGVASGMAIITRASAAPAS